MVGRPHQGRGRTGSRGSDPAAAVVRSLIVVLALVFASATVLDIASDHQAHAHGAAAVAGENVDAGGEPCDHGDDHAGSSCLVVDNCALCVTPTVSALVAPEDAGTARLQPDGAFLGSQLSPRFRPPKQLAQV